MIRSSAHKWITWLAPSPFSSISPLSMIPCCCSSMILALEHPDQRASNHHEFWARDRDKTRVVIILFYYVDVCTCSCDSTIFAVFSLRSLERNLIPLRIDVWINVIEFCIFFSFFLFFGGGGHLSDLIIWQYVLFNDVQSCSMIDNLLDKNNNNYSD